MGGSFRTIGSAFISRTGYPLHVLHGLKIKRKDVLAICHDLRSDEPSLEGAAVEGCYNPSCCDDYSRAH